MHLVGFIIKKFVTIHGHMKVKKKVTVSGKAKDLSEPSPAVCLYYKQRASSDVDFDPRTLSPVIQAYIGFHTAWSLRRQ